jgi:hypothetical protein
VSGTITALPDEDQEMSDLPEWECQRSVDADVPVSFAWQVMPDVIRSGIEPNLEPGRRRIAARMERAAEREARV